MTHSADYVLTVGSLFSGIGGLELGLERAGMRTIWHSEIEPYACKVLARHWPSVPNLGDITTIDWSSVERPDVLCGGFPCQPVSSAGSKKAQADSRWLWPAFADAVRHLQPRWVLAENVTGLLGHAMGDVLGDLASLGYDAQWDCIPALAVGAPHRRERIFLVGYPQRTPPDLLAQAGSPWHPASESSWWATEPGVGRMVDGLSGRVDRLRCLGNAVVPQVAEHVGRLILAAHSDGSECAQ